MRSSLCVWVFGVVVLCLSAQVARAEESQIKEAGKHFTRAVTLYEEADYRAALVEFRKAYKLAPNATVLYNIGQTQYQLQNYASALQTLERYLAESGPNAAHRDEVKKTLDTLRSRVGHIKITTNVAGAEITVDDELVGTTPFKEPVLVSIGRRKVVAMRAGRQPETKFVEVAAGEALVADFTLGAGETSGNPDPAAKAKTSSGKSNAAKIGWVSTGLLAVGAGVVGYLAYDASNGLDTARGAFPADPADLERRASKVQKLSLAADILTGAALIVGSISLYVTVSKSKSREVRVGMSGGNLVIGGNFR
jgi:hypothetical protein